MSMQEQPCAVQDHSNSSDWEIGNSKPTRAFQATASSGPSAMDEVALFVQRNPILTIAGVATAGILLSMALRRSSSPPPSRLRSMERRAMRQVRSMGRRWNSMMDQSGLPSTLDRTSHAVAGRWSSFDRSTIEPWLDTLARIVQRSSRRNWF